MRSIGQVRAEVLAFMPIGNSLSSPVGVDVSMLGATLGNLASQASQCLIQAKTQVNWAQRILAMRLIRHFVAKKTILEWQQITSRKGKRYAQS
jgi:hypothetical protein